jgi:hypothetical protein
VVPSPRMVVWSRCAATRRALSWARAAAIQRQVKATEVPVRLSRVVVGMSSPFAVQAEPAEDRCAFCHGPLAVAPPAAEGDVGGFCPSFLCSRLAPAPAWVSLLVGSRIPGAKPERISLTVS